MGLAFPSHVHACLANDQVVFLNERADTYSALSPDLVPLFKRLLAGAATDEDAQAVAAQLLPAGLLTRTDAADGLALAKIDRPASGRADEPTRLTFSHDLVSALACRGHWSVRARWQRPDGYFAILRRRKAKLLARLQSSPPLESAETHAKPMLDTRWLLPTHDKCLPWSMAMASHLIHHGIPVDLVIGVKMKPFGAHAWVQYQGAVLSDIYDEVIPFTPILVI